MQLAQEAQRAIRFVSETPCLNYVLGLAPPEQPELSEEDAVNEEVEEPGGSSARSAEEFADGDSQDNGMVDEDFTSDTSLPEPFDEPVFS